MKAYKTFVAASGLLLTAAMARAQLTSDEVSALRNELGNRIEAATILGGDFGLSAADFRVSKTDNIHLEKFGGGGELGDPKPLGDSSVRWQPRVQGQLGFFEAKSDVLPGRLSGSEDDIRSFALQLGGGARFWFDEHFNVAPTLTGMYGHTASSFYPNGVPFSVANVEPARAEGLIDWNVDTWTIRPAAEIQYKYVWKRGIYAVTSNPVYFHTEDFRTSNPNLHVNGNSWTWDNKFDADIPLGTKLWGRELRAGGYFSRTEVRGSLKDGLDGCDHIYEVHPRLVLDFLHQFWYLQWVGIGASYLWGNNFSGYSIGADVAFRF